MLIVSRKAGQKLIVDTPLGKVTIGVVSSHYGKVRLEIFAPAEIDVYREELEQGHFETIH